MVDEERKDRENQHTNPVFINMDPAAAAKIKKPNVYLVQEINMTDLARKLENEGLI